MAQITRLGLAGISRHLYGSFAGKTLDVGGPHNPDHITRLGLAGISRHRYGSFAGKTATEAADFIFEAEMIMTTGSLSVR